MENRKLKIRDLTMRDGQQSLFATRMSQSTIDKLLPLYENAGFYIMEVWGGAVPDSVMRYLDESPWNRLRRASEAMKGRSLLSALSRGRNLFGYVPYPDSVLEGFYKEAIKNGLNVMRIFDALNDIDNVRATCQTVSGSPHAPLLFPDNCFRFWSAGFYLPVQLIPFQAFSHLSQPNYTNFITLCQ